jgi:hypothetical protein
MCHSYTHCSAFINHVPHMPRDVYSDMTGERGKKRRNGMGDAENGRMRVRTCERLCAHFMKYIITAAVLLMAAGPECIPLQCCGTNSTAIDATNSCMCEQSIDLSVAASFLRALPE